jgi:hypothetical protein
MERFKESPFWGQIQNLQNSGLDFAFGEAQTAHLGRVKTRPSLSVVKQPGQGRQSAVQQTAIEMLIPQFEEWAESQAKSAIESEIAAEQAAAAAERDGLERRAREAADTARQADALRAQAEKGAAEALAVAQAAADAEKEAAALLEAEKNALAEKLAAIEDEIAAREASGQAARDRASKRIAQGAIGLMAMLAIVSFYLNFHNASVLWDFFPTPVLIVFSTILAVMPFLYAWLADDFEVKVAIAFTPLDFLIAMVIAFTGDLADLEGFWLYAFYGFAAICYLTQLGVVAYKLYRIIYVRQYQGFFNTLFKK